MDQNQLTQLSKELKISTDQILREEAEMIFLDALSKDKLGGKIVNVYENQIYYPEARYMGEMALGIGGGVAPAPEIEVGENEVSVEVSVTYEVK